MSTLGEPGFIPSRPATVQEADAMRAHEARQSSIMEDPDFRWMGEPVSGELLDEVHRIMAEDISADPHPGHFSVPTPNQMKRARAALASKVLAGAIQSAGVSAEEATQAVQQLSRIGGFVIERPQSVRETMEGLAVVQTFDDDDEEFRRDSSNARIHSAVSRALGLDREEQVMVQEGLEEREYPEWIDNFVFDYRLERALKYIYRATMGLIDMVTRPMLDHRARVKEQVRLDALPNPLRNPRRDVRV